jgi:hypothetical protein
LLVVRGVRNINFFLDTTLLYSDPFLRGNFTKKMVEIARRFGFTIYMSPVVVEETKSKLHHQVTENIHKIQTGAKQLGRLIADRSVNIEVPVTADECVIEFQRFIDELESEGILVIPEYDVHLFPELVDRAIHRTKPFSEGKQEFRDATTWLIYAQLAEEKELEKCFFITDNIKDFYDDRQEGLHPDLLQDSTRFKMYRSTKEMFEHEEELMSLANTAEFINGATEELTPDKVEALLEFPLFDELFAAATSYIENEDLESLNGAFYLGGFALTDSMGIESVGDIRVNEMDPEIIVSGTVTVEVQCTAHVYNMFRDRGEDHYNEQSLEVRLEVEFSFIYREERTPANFEAHGMRILQSFSDFDEEPDGPY